jgi:hypothetical protein
MNIDITGALQSLLTHLGGNEPLPTTALLLIGAAVLVYSKGVRDKLLNLDRPLTALFRRVLRHSH